VNLLYNSNDETGVELISLQGRRLRREWQRDVCTGQRLSWSVSTQMLCYVIMELTLRPVFAGKEPNKALGQSSLKPEDCISDYSTLSDSEKKVLNDWHTFFSKRYNIVGRLPAENAASL
jgi:hypothetical protein